MLALLALAAEGYFALLAHRLHSTTLATLEARAEKDALIGELEQAKAISDEARHRAESANVAKSRFLAQMSHELRTPLNAILGFSEVMKSEIFGEHAVPVYKEYSADIHNSGVHLLNLINEILDLSRIEAGRYELNEEAVSLVHVVADCHHLLKLRASSRGITIHEVFEQGMPRIWGDERADAPDRAQSVVELDQVHAAGRRDLAEGRAGPPPAANISASRTPAPASRKMKSRSCWPRSARAPIRSNPPNRARAWACRSPRA